MGDDRRVEFNGGAKAVDENDIRLAGTETSAIQGFAINDGQPYAATKRAASIADSKRRLGGHLGCCIGTCDPITKSLDSRNGDSNLIATL